MFDNLNLQELLGDIQKKAKDLEQKNEDLVFSVKSGGGMVNVSINGNGEVIDIAIDDSLLSDKDSLQILLISAVNDAIKIVENNKKQSAFQLLNGFNIPNFKS